MNGYTVRNVERMKKILFVRNLYLLVAFDARVSARRLNDGPFVCAYWKFFFSARSRGGGMWISTTRIRRKFPHTRISPTPARIRRGVGGGWGSLFIPVNFQSSFSGLIYLELSPPLQRTFLKTK